MVDKCCYFLEYLVVFHLSKELKWDIYRTGVASESSLYFSFTNDQEL